jgi:hypothetical protein
LLEFFLALEHTIATTVVTTLDVYATCCGVNEEVVDVNRLKVRLVAIHAVGVIGIDSTSIKDGLLLTYDVLDVPIVPLCIECTEGVEAFYPLELGILALHILEGERVIYLGEEGVYELLHPSEVYVSA